MTLRSRVIQESEFQTVASETVHGVAGRMVDMSVPKYMHRGPRTMFGNQIDINSPGKAQCTVCGAQHDLWDCQEVLQMNVPER